MSVDTLLPPATTTGAAALDRIVARHGRLDILISNAGQAIPQAMTIKGTSVQ